MPKQRSLGTLSDLVTTPETPPETPESHRISELEKRVATLEMLLNDVMHQLDRPQNTPKQTEAKGASNAKNPKTQSNGNLGSKRKTASAPVSQKRAKTEKSSQQELDKQTAEKAKQEALEAAYALVKELLSDGEKRTESQIYEALPELSKKKFKKVRHHYLQDDGNKDREARLYFLG